MVHSRSPDPAPVEHSNRSAVLGTALALTALVLLAAAPPVIEIIEKPFYLDILTRVIILGVAAVSLNLILGYGGMISFGHSAYIGIGAYAVGIPAYYEVYNGFVQLGVALAASAAFALVTGFVCLRTRGVYFIMITLAFTQMIYFAFVSIEEYGGDDGLVIDVRSELGGLVDLESNLQLYYVSLAVLAAAVFAVHRIVRSRFGMVIRGSKGNDERMRAMGYNTFRYRLGCYVISGAMCGLAGWLLGNFTSFISPEMMDWTRSGELIFMVVLGGTGTLLGPLLGSGVFLLLEEALSAITIYWQILFGTFLILVVLFVPGGVAGLLARVARREGR